MSTLTPQQLKAVNYYMKGYNRKEALLMAGYSRSVAETDASSIFSRGDVKLEVEKRKRGMVERNNVTEDWIVQRLMAIAGANPGDMIEIDEVGNPYINWDKLTPGLRSAIGGFSEEVYVEGRGGGARKVKRMKVKERDALRALELLGKYLGMWREKVELNGDADLIARLQAGRSRVATDSSSRQEGEGDDV